jgi:hypothetical protein
MHTCIIYVNKFNLKSMSNESQAPQCFVMNNPLLTNRILTKNGMELIIIYVYLYVYLYIYTHVYIFVNTNVHV